jgi:hypothetical protein
LGKVRLVRRIVVLGVHGHMLPLRVLQLFRRAILSQVNVVQKTRRSAAHNTPSRID